MGAPAFGLEVILISGEGNFVSFSDERLKIVAISFFIGFLLVGASIFVNYILDFGPLFVCVSLFAEIFLVGRILSFTNLGTGDRELINARRRVTDEEIEDMLKDRGLDELVENSDDN